MSIPKFVNMTKNIPFFPILHVFAPLNDVRVNIAWSWKTTLITWIFLRGWYPTSDTSDPPPGYAQREKEVINQIKFHPQTSGTCAVFNKPSLEYTKFVNP